MNIVLDFGINLVVFLIFVLTPFLIKFKNDHNISRHIHVHRYLCCGKSTISHIVFF
ncbi:hypothetical protein DFP96_11233 [Listeria rocourtiae]|uniref:Uncharacterized protein n=1 Tax=Listeria rocourtiae TaxID=647910 RepID=A0A4R6ZGZ2_9LIST|nr:hypothetical protein DFP96_11233 [Listeria rocourtiae]